MAQVSNIQWFPGHMTKTKRQIEADLKLVDAVAEIVDSRIPESSRNPVISDITGSKPRIILLNKCDYADEKVTAEWQKYYTAQGYKAMICDCRSGKGVKAFTPNVKNLLSDLLAKRKAKGIVGQSLRVMVVGIPNVGKSSFINRISKAGKTKVEDRPGVTRGAQWVSLDKELELLDTPGILWPKFDDQQVAIKLGYTGAIKDDVMDVCELADNLLGYLWENYKGNVITRYKLDENTEKPDLEMIARKRGMLISGGEPDIERAAAAGVVNLAESLSKDLKTGEEKKDLFLYDNEMRTHCGVICGIDEAGRGPLAGDVYAAAVILPDDIIIDGINDSKKLTEKKREALFDIIREKAVSYCIATASVEEIDSMNILNAAMLAMKRAYEGLDVKPDTALIDGNKTPGLDIPETAVVKGDATSASIAAASILAKVARDRYMKELAEKYPQYMFEKHKGYGTKLHYEMLDKYGASDIHRKSFLVKYFKAKNAGK